MSSIAPLRIDVRNVASTEHSLDFSLTVFVRADIHLRGCAGNPYEPFYAVEGVLSNGNTELKEYVMHVQLPVAYEHQPFSLVLHPVGEEYEYPKDSTVFCVTPSTKSSKHACMLLVLFVQ